MKLELGSTRGTYNIDGGSIVVDYVTSAKTMVIIKYESKLAQ